MKLLCEIKRVAGDVSASIIIKALGVLGGLVLTWQTPLGNPVCDATDGRWCFRAVSLVGPTKGREY